MAGTAEQVARVEAEIAKLQSRVKAIQEKLARLAEKKKQLQLPGENSLHRLEDYLITHAEDDTCLGILIAFHTGIRLGELCALTWECIDLEESVLSIKRSMQRTSGFSYAQACLCHQMHRYGIRCQKSQ